MRRPLSRPLSRPRLDFRLPLSDTQAMEDEKKPVRNNQVSRILRIIHFLEVNPQGLTAKELKDKVEDDGFKCSLRTIYNDIDAIGKAHMPIMGGDDDPDGRWKLDSVATLSRNIKISYPEILALYLSQEALAGFSYTPLWEPIRNLFQKLESAIGHKGVAQLNEMAKHLVIKPSETWQTTVSQEILNTIHDSCIEGHILEFEYRPPGAQVSHRKVAPLALYFADSSVYLVAKDYKDGIHKKFAISRVLTATMTEIAHEEPEFDLDSFLKGSIGILGSGETAEIEVVFQEPIASYISERRWHDTQKLVRTPDGLRLTMKVSVNQELARWVLSFGPHARAVAPQALVSEVEALAISVSKMYERKKAA